VGEAVVLVDDDGVAHRVHAHALERHPRDRPGPALPRLDPHPVVGATDHRVANRDVGHAGPGPSLAQAADWQWTSFFSAASAALYMYLYSIHYYHVKTKMSGFSDQFVLRLHIDVLPWSGHTLW
jgi:hypothetical protein